MTEQNMGQSASGDPFPMAPVTRCPCGREDRLADSMCNACFEDLVEKNWKPILGPMFALGLGPLRERKGHDDGRLRRSR